MLKHKKIRKRIPALLICILYTMTVLLSMTGCGTKKTGSGGAASEESGAASEENGRDTQAESGSVAAMGRYMESTAPLPEGASVEGRTMTMLTDGRLAYFDAKSGLHRMREKAGYRRNIMRSLKKIFPRMVMCPALPLRLTGVYC